MGSPPSVLQLEIAWKLFLECPWGPRATTATLRRGLRLFSRPEWPESTPLPSLPRLRGREGRGVGTAPTPPAVGNAHWAPDASSCQGGSSQAAPEWRLSCRGLTPAIHSPNPTRSLQPI